MIYHIEIDLNFSVIQYSSKDARGGRQVVLATVLEWWVSSAGGGGVSGVVGMLTMRRLKAPARHKPAISKTAPPASRYAAVSVQASQI
jgi:hypothetical protein